MLHRTGRNTPLTHEWGFDMYRDTLVEAADTAIKNAPIAEMSKATKLPEMLLRGILNTLRSRVLALTEEQAEKVINSIFDIVDRFRERLNKKPETDESASGDNP